MGATVAAAGDVNADGCDDVIIGAPFYPAGDAQLDIVIGVPGWTGTRSLERAADLLNNQETFTVRQSNGSYIVELTVTDDMGATASDVMLVTIEAPPPPSTNLPPLAGSAEATGGVASPGRGKPSAGTRTAWDSTLRLE